MFLTLWLLTTVLATGWTSERARYAVLKRHHPNDSERLDAARRDLRIARATEYIRELVDAAPPLNAEQKNRLAVLLLSEPTGGGS